MHKAREREEYTRMHTQTHTHKHNTTIGLCVEASAVLGVEMD
jgi:hypothetical protein